MTTDSGKSNSRCARLGCTQASSFRRRLRDRWGTRGSYGDVGNVMQEGNPEFPDSSRVKKRHVFWAPCRTLRGWIGQECEERAHDPRGDVLHAGRHAAAEAEVVTRALDQKEVHRSRNQLQCRFYFFR